MDKRKLMSVEQDTFVGQINAFKHPGAILNQNTMSTPEKSCSSSNKKLQKDQKKKLQQSIHSLQTTLLGQSFYKNDEKVDKFTQNYSEDRKTTLRKLIQQAYVQLKLIYVAQKQKDKYNEEIDNQDKQNTLQMMLYGMGYSKWHQNDWKLTQEIKQSSLNKLEQIEFIKLSQDDQLILLLKFVIGRKSNIIPWTVLPISEEEAYLYIQQNIQYLRNLYDSKLKIYMRNIVTLYQHTNITVVTLFLILFQKLGMKFDVQNQKPDFMNEKVTKGMLGIQFHLVPYNFQGFNS